MRRLRWLLIPALVVALLAAGMIYVLEGVWVREKVRTLIVTEVEKATGGRTSLTAFDFDWRTLKVTASEFVIHGKEGPERPPFVRVRAIRAGLTVRSWWQKDVQLSELVVEKPEVHIYVNPDGSTNIPNPKVPLKTNAAPLEDLIRLKIGRLDVRDGVFEYSSKQVPFSTLAQGLNLILTYDKRTPRYLVTLAAAEMHLPGLLHPRVEASAVLEANRVTLERVRAFIGDSVGEFTGAINDFRHPKVDGQVKASVLLRDIEISPVRQGFGVVTGRLHYSAERDFFIDGTVRAEQVAYGSKEFKVSRAQIDSNFHLTTSLLKVSGTTLRTPLGEWQGEGAIRQWREFELNGEATRVDLDGLQTAFLDRPYAWSGSVRGPLSFRGELTETGLRNGGAEAELSIEPKEGELPVRGNLNLAWSQESGKLDFGSSNLATDSARVNFHGVLGERLEVGFFATRIRDVEPVIAMLLHEDDYHLPVRLQAGEARFDGLITGAMQHLDIAGHASISNVVYEGILFERAAGDVHLTESQLALSGLEVRSETAEATGGVRLGLADWSAGWNSAVTGKLQVKRMEVQRLLRMAKLTAPLQGTLDAALDVGGTLGMPQGQLAMGVAGAAWDAEKFKDLKASVTLDGAGALLGQSEFDGSRVELTGSYKHPQGDFDDGELRGTVTVAGLDVQEVETVRAARPALFAVLSGELSARVELVGGVANLRALDGRLTAPMVKVGTRDLGALSVSGSTSGETLRLKLKQGLPSGEADGEAAITLKGDYMMEGSVKAPRLGFGLLRDLSSSSPKPQGETPWPVRGFVEGQATFRLPLTEPKKASAVLTVSALQLRPRQEQSQETQLDSSELTLRNAGPVVLELDAQSMRVRSAKFTALETDLTLAGSYIAGAKNPWNMNMQGSVNLAVLGSFYTDLLATGSAKLEATVRGAAADPQFNGRMSIQNASFFLKDLPNGIEKATGTVYFDKNRANIEKLTGQTGGGAFEVTGFVGFATTDLTYRLNLNAKTVRVRYPEGVSTTLDAALTLSGATSRSLLAGTITIQKSGLNSGADLANVVGTSGNPIPSAAAQNEFLRNLQFDVRVRTSPDAIFQSSYTQDLQTEADLRLRGSPSKPILLGGIKANQGAVKFFGNQFTISRGEVLFYSTAIVQPQIDLDLETKVRGITVYINVNGPLSRLNFNYRSEPPLQSSEIMALLTVGRTPASTTSSLAASDNIRSQNVMENTPNSLLGGAISAGLSSRAERFFGSSRIRLDPSAAGVENLPQARLSIEQSLSRDITLTFITNLSRSQQQVVRVDWDFSRQWSVVALKDENGAFAIDFLLRRRFK
ncbi:MAG TPA: translocation/assembly module TamB domain-containing protein [Paludibaculum sp.]|jgi:translocation and assembly module TamB